MEPTLTYLPNEVLDTLPYLPQPEPTQSKPNSLFHVTLHNYINAAVPDGFHRAVAYQLYVTPYKSEDFQHLRRPTPATIATTLGTTEARVASLIPLIRKQILTYAKKYGGLKNIPR